jgi:hypothetical protein
MVVTDVADKKERSFAYPGAAPPDPRRAKDRRPGLGETR